VCAVIPAPDASPSEALAAELSAAVVAGLGTSFRPKSVLFVADLPRTRNMKIMRRAIRATLIGEAPGDLSTLVNPEALDELKMVAAGS
jgi:acetyl-CoA synthetase